MDSTKTKHIKDPNSWQSGAIRILHCAMSWKFIQQAKNCLLSWRLFLFLFGRTKAGKWITQRMGKLKFYRKRFGHTQIERIFSTWNETLTTWHIITLTVWPIIFSALAIAFFIGLPIAYNALAVCIGWPGLTLPKVTDENYKNLMSTVAQAAAAVLALFFAAISVVASTTYAKVSTEIRTLVAEDDLNRRYLGLLAHTAATAIAAIGLHTMGVTASIVLSAYIILLSIICLLAFLPLAIRTFALFDQAALIGYPARHFLRVLRIVTIKGRRWLDPPFQNHARIIAEKQLRLIEDLVIFSISDKRFRNDTVLKLVKSIHRIVRYYTAQKSSIPSESLWFPRKAEFRRWQMTSSPMTDIALQTGVAPSPEYVPDRGFIEARCEEITLNCLQYMLKNNTIDDVVSLLLEVNKTVTMYARSFDQREAMELVAVIRKYIVDLLKEIETTNQTLTHQQIVDVVCVAALAPILNTSQSIIEFSTEKLVSLANSILTLRRRRLYEDTHPRNMLKDAEDLMQRLEFEKATEGTVRTQPWYICQLLAFALAEFIREVIKNIINTVDQEFVKPAAELVEAKQPLLAGVWWQRGIEACKKANDQICGLESLYSELKKFHVTELEWYPSGSETALSALEDSRIMIMKLLIKIVPDLCSSASDDSLPDLLGQTRAWIAEELFLMMERKEETSFPELFVAFFNSSLAVQRQFTEIAKQPEKLDYIRVAMDITIDIMDISGLAFLFTELDVTRFGQIVVGA